MIKILLRVLFKTQKIDKKNNYKKLLIERKNFVRKGIKGDRKK